MSINAINAVLLKANADIAAVESDVSTAQSDISTLQSAAGPGLVLISRTTIGNDVTSVTVSNAFSADYDNYRIVVTGGQTPFDVVYSMYLLGSTSSVYNQQYRMTYGTSISSSSKTRTFWEVAPFGSSAASSCIDIFNPYVSTTRTSVIYTGLSNPANWLTGVGWHDVTASYTGFVLYDTGGQTAVTGGTIDVYGYAKS